MDLSVVILAAGVGKRMHSRLPKVLHSLGGKALLEHVVQTVGDLSLNASPLVVYGHGGEEVMHKLAHLHVTWVKQAEQLGTGHALQQALPHLSNQGRVLILYGDVPLISAETLAQFIKHTPDQCIGMITATLPNPHGFGRVIRDARNTITAVIEEKETTPSQQAIKEINSGIYLIPNHFLQKWLPLLKNNNTQKEFYLTDIIQLAVNENVAIHSLQPIHTEEILGINDCRQLAELERHYQLQKAHQFMQKGVTLKDPHRFDVRGNVSMGKDVVIDVNVIFEGDVKIGNHCVVGPNTLLRNVMIGDHVEILANSVIDGAEIANNCIIGPFARIRPGAELADHCHIGNFVEIKNSLIGSGAKINHLSYIGDSDIGKKANIGAGTITCNYDGVNKHKTTIGDNAFIGSNTSLVAPITIGEGATIGASSTITRDAPAHQLTLCRAEQRTIANWQRPTKKQTEPGT